MNESPQSCEKASLVTGIKQLTSLHAPTGPLASPRRQPQDHSQKLLREMEMRSTGRTWL